MSESLERISASLADRYAVVRELGRGGAATVYLADDVRHGRKVAIKVLHEDLAASLGGGRFLSEVRITAQLQHPHILTLIDSGEAAGLPWYAMPYIQGESLRTRIDREGELPIDEAIRLTRDVADALAHAHAHNVVHRDIKPENVLISGRHAMVADFGVAKALRDAGGERGVTATGMALGTPAYMSPEQAAADPGVDKRTDIYALGLLAYEMLTGRPPFGGATSQAIMAAHMMEAPVHVSVRRATVPPEFAALVMRCLEKKPADRPQSADEILNLLDSGAALRAPATQTTPGSTRLVSTLPPARSRWLRIAVAGAAAALVGGGWYVATRAHGSVIASASTIAILPATPASSDSALARLGRDLVVTLSTNLDGAGPIRTIDALTTLAQVPAGSGQLTTQDGVALARRLGAASVVQGTLIRVGENVRFDLSLLRTSDASVITRISATASQHDIVALTDSATWGLLREVWRGPDAPTPSFGAVATRSLPALKAFLEGEQAIAVNKWDDAADAFATTIAADSSFWWAYCRYNYSRSWTLRGASVSREARICQEHRAELPERERLMVSFSVPPDSLTPITERLRLQRLQEITQRFPDYWPGWMAYADRQIHYGYAVGGTFSSARAGFERAAELNPRFAPAWQHLAWIYLSQRDTAALRVALDTLRALGGIPAREENGYRGLQRLLSGQTLPEGWINQHARNIVAEFAAGALAAELANGDFLHYGFPALELEQAREMLATPGVAPVLASLSRRQVVWSWMARGGWDSALVAAVQNARQDTSTAAQLEPYRVSALGAFFGALDPHAAAAHRGTAEQKANSAGTVAARARLLWLDALIAVARRDSAAIARVRSELAVVRDSVDFDAVLAAFELERRGDVRGAAEALLEFETRTRDVGRARFAPGDVMFNPLIRIVAARWLALSGDATAALGMLDLFDDFAVTNSFDANATLAGFAILERARISEGKGDCEPARRNYENFLGRYDAAGASHRHLVDEANSALARLRTGEAACQQKGSKSSR
jgi:serine/threonine-protein kinase